MAPAKAGKSLSEVKGVKMKDFRPAIRRVLKWECSTDFLNLLTPWPFHYASGFYRERELKFRAWLMKQPHGLTRAELWERACQKKFYSRSNSMAYAVMFNRYVNCRPLPASTLCADHRARRASGAGKSQNIARQKGAQ